jgi:hypothetical protein
MEIDFRKKKKVPFEEIEIAAKKDAKEFEDDAQSYYKSLRARQEKEQAQREIEKKKILKEEEKKKEEKKAYYEEIKKIYRDKKKEK